MSEQLVQAAPVDLAERVEALQSAMNALEKQIGRAGREQLKANALAETQAERLAGALEALRSADERREAELVAQRERNRSAVSEARLEVARAMFPVLDGLDEALRTGRAVLDHERRPPPETLLRRLLLGASDQERPDPQRAALDAWLAGLEIVRRRLLDALAAEGVTPIAAAGQPFDPQRHIAVEVISAASTPPGTVAQEIRRGFLAGQRVLRHAEVAVTG